MSFLKQRKTFLVVLLYALPLMAFPQLKFAVVDSARALVTWRTDDGRILGGFVNAQPELTGSIRELFGNEHLVTNTSGDVLVVRRTDHTSDFQDSWADSGQVLFNNGSLGSIFPLSLGTYPECNMGELPNAQAFCPLGSNFLAAYSSSGNLWLRTFTVNGETQFEYSTYDALLDMQVASLNDTTALLLWYKGSAVTETDTLVNGIYALIYRNGQVLADSLLVQAYPGVPQYLPSLQDEVPLFRLAANPAGDGYQLFIAEPDSARLRVLQLDAGALITGEQLIPFEYNPGNNWMEALRLSNFTAGSRSVLVQVQSPIGRDYRLFYFDRLGNQIDSESQFSEEWLWSDQAFGFKTAARRFVNGQTFFGDVEVMAVEHFVNSDSVTISSVNSVDRQDTHLAHDFRLSAAWPNPFNPTTRLLLELPTPATIRADLVNMRGQQIHALMQGTFPAGKHEIRIDGSGLASGVYFVRVRLADGRQLLRKCLLVK